MHNEFNAIIEKDNDWFISYCPEIPGANGQGRTKEKCLESLSDAIKLIGSLPFCVGKLHIPVKVAG